MREIVHIQAGQCGNQIGAKVSQTGPRRTNTPKNTRAHTQYSFENFERITKYESANCVRACVVNNFEGAVPMQCSEVTARMGAPN